VDPALFADANYRFGSPNELLLAPDHYVLRMLYSQGISLESLGIEPASQAGQPHPSALPVERDPRRVWQTFADHFYLFQGTPTGGWLRDELEQVFGIEEKLTGESAQRVYDQISSKLASDEFRPRKLFESFGIEVLCTTDAATDDLSQHRAIRESGWGGRILPTFRPDAVVNLLHPQWRSNVELLAERTSSDIGSYQAYIAALENRRSFFRAHGATATDHASLTAQTGWLDAGDADRLFAKALASGVSEAEAQAFNGHLLMEMARMSVDDNLVMQLHVGSSRNHNPLLFEKFGPDRGCDIPIATQFTTGLRPLLQEFGNSTALRLILFTLDETTYARELAPLAGHYPALLVGPPWWFHDSLNGMRRFFDQVMETAGIYNTAGFNDDTRAFPSIPARHDVWRRAAADWVAGLVVEGVVDDDDAQQMIRSLAYDLAKSAYRL
jgi:glucuronate isomerase